MIKLPQVSHERVVRALKRAGFYVLGEGKHISMTDEKHIVIIPRHHVIKAGTPAHQVIKDAWSSSLSMVAPHRIGHQFRQFIWPPLFP